MAGDGGKQLESYVAEAMGDGISRLFTEAKITDIPVAVFAGLLVL